ncbi:MAG: glutathione synthetase [Gemmatimonadaceae bacterium]
MIRIGFVVNECLTEEPEYTTTRLAMRAIEMGHEAWVMGVGDLAYDADETVSARARSAQKKKYATGKEYLADLNGDKARKRRLDLAELDVILLRNDPSIDSLERPWAQAAGVVFGRRAMRRGVIVLNDPDGLAKAINKMYFQDFPAEVRPRTLITRDRSEIKAFAKVEGGKIVLKPLTGSGGQSVFLVRPDDVPNLNQMIDAISRDGYVVAQEYLPAAARGDTRLFMLNGEPFRHKGKYAAFRRLRQGGDMRSNIHAGGKLAPAEIGDVALQIAEIIRPKLVMDGMFIVGLDIVGDKLMEINVFSPGGLGSASRFERVDFTTGVIEALERKVLYAHHYRRASDNPIIATL